MSEYPPEPWYLGGSLLVSAFLVPPRELLAFSIPDGRRPLRLGGKIVVGTAFVKYVPGGVLEYNELLVALPSFPGPRVTIPQIWVDSPASQAGGRALWGIPKQLASFTRVDDGRRVRTAMADARGAVASLRAHYGLPLLPGMRQLALPILQHESGRRILSHNRVVGRIGGLRATWTFDPAGPLAWLAGRRPLFNVAIRDASIIFGMDVKRS